MFQQVERSYLVDLLNQCYLIQEENCYFCKKFNCIFCQRTLSFGEELWNKGFNNKHSKVQNWFITHFEKNYNVITAFPVSDEWKIDN